MPAAASFPEPVPGAASGRAPLSDRDRRILALEGRTFRYLGAKERHIREQLGMTPTAYFVRLNALLDEPAALREAPAVVHRLRARRVSSQESSAGRAGGTPTGRVA